MSEIAEEYAALPPGEVEVVEVMEGEIGEGEVAPETRPETMPPGLKRSGCQCVTDHRPAVVGTDFHHVVPLGWGGPDVKENIVELCPTTHRSLHDLLRWIVREQRWPGREVLYRFPRYVQLLAARAVREHGIPKREAIPRTFGGLVGDE